MLYPLKHTTLTIEEKKSITSSYKGKSLRLLTQLGISLGDTLKLNISGNQFTGILMPRYESAVSKSPCY